MRKDIALEFTDGMSGILGPWCTYCRACCPLLGFYTLTSVAVARVYGRVYINVPECVFSQLNVRCICPLVLQQWCTLQQSTHWSSGVSLVSMLCTEKPEEPVCCAAARHQACSTVPPALTTVHHMGTAGLDKAGAGGALTPKGGTQSPHTGPPMAAPQCSDYRQVAPRSKRSSDLFESSNKSRVVGLVCLKVLDLAVHFYTVAISSYSLHLAVASLHQVNGEPSTFLRI